jgi:hypothetical protein
MTLNSSKTRSFAIREQILLGLTNFRTKGPILSPTINQKRAEFVIDKIDQILDWERGIDKDRETRFLDLGKYLCEVRAGQYWRLENLHSFDEFLEKRFPGSRRRAYYFMSIHEHLPKQTRKEVKEIGWSKAVELVKVARADGERFESATWLHKARNLPKEDFKQTVEQHLTGKESEAYEIVYFKFYNSQLRVIEQALETAALLLGSDKSRGYCLEMICADFLAGVNLDNEGDQVLVSSLKRYFELLQPPQKIAFLESIRQAA